MDDFTARVRRWGRKKVTQMDVTNRDCVVPPQELCCTEYCFKLDFDFTLRRRQEGIKGIYDEQRDRFCAIITALLNTSGGVLVLHSILPISKNVLSAWLSNASQLLVCVSRDVLDCGPIDYIIQEHSINILVKKAPEFITCKSNMYTRSSDANSYMCYDAKAIKSIMTQEGSPARAKVIPQVYGQQLDPEDRHTEYKHYNVTKSTEIIAKLEQDVNCIFALGNIPGGGDVFLGVLEDKQKYIIKGINIDETEQNQFKHDLSLWMIKSRDGAYRIWGKEDTVPAEGLQWNLDFISLSCCPAGEQKVLVKIHINFCQGGLFERAPESCIVESNGFISVLGFQQWRKMVLSVYQNDETIIKKSCVKNAETQTIPGIKNEPADSISTVRYLVNKVTSINIFKRQNEDSGDSQTSAKHPKMSDDSMSSSQDTESQPSTSYASEDGRADDQDDLVAVSWADSQSNVKYLSRTRHCGDISYLKQHCGIAEGDPIHFFPNKDKFVHLASTKIDPVLFPNEKILLTLLHLENTYRGQPGFAIPLISWADQVGLDSYKETPFGHMFDILVGCGSNLEMWPIFNDMKSDKSLKLCYAYELCRILKRNLLLRTKPKTVQNLKIKPILYCADSGLVQPGLDQSLSLVRDIQDTWSSREGLSKFTLTEALVSLLMAGTDTWIKDRFGREKHYSLTTMQVRSSFQCLSGVVNMIEGPPGVGKSIIVSYLCDVYGGHERKEKVLCLCPRKPFSKFLEFQQKSTVVHIESQEQMLKVISEIDDGGYDAVIVDDSQDMSLTYEIWSSLYLKIYLIWRTNSDKTTKLFIFLDSEMQIFGDINQARIARAAFRNFIEEHNISFTDLSLHEVMRNTQNVFSFMVANVFQDLTLKGCEISSRHPLPGDDVTMLEIINLWADSYNNGVLMHIYRLIYKPMSGYEISDIVVLVDQHEDAVFLREVFKRHWPIVRNKIVNDATIFPVDGLTIDTAHNFLGLEARVCIHASRADNPRVLNETRYRVYITSRGTERVDFLFPSSFDAHKAHTMGYEDLSTARMRGSGSDRHLEYPSRQSTLLRQPRIEPLVVFGKKGEEDGHFDYLCGVAMFPDGGIVTADYGKKSIQLFDQHGQHIWSFPTKFGARDVSCIKDDHLVAVDSHTVYNINRDGTKKWEVDLSILMESAQGSAKDSTYIYGVTMSREGQIYVRLPYSVCVLYSSGDVIRHIQSEYITFTTFVLQGIAINNDNNLILPDYEEGCIQVITQSGELVRSIGSQTKGPGKLLSPTDVAVDEDDNIIVADDKQCRLSIFNPSGEFVRYLGTGKKGKGFGSFNKPIAVAVAGENIVVSDSGNQRIQIF